MTYEEIKALPKEFDFKSNINKLDLTYHAVEKEYWYIVTADGEEWNYEKSDIHQYLLQGSFYLVDAPQPLIVYALTCTVGISSGYKKLIGVYSTLGVAEKAKQTDAKQNALSEWHYSIQPITVDKTVNETYVEW